MSMRRTGFLKLYVGPMFSGKTSDMIAEVCKRNDLGYKCCIINSNKDIRDVGISSHASLFSGIPPKVKVFKHAKLTEFKDEKFEVIGIDEAQFFPDLVDEVAKLVASGKFVFVSGLSGTSEMEKFGSLLDLFPMADEVVHKKAECRVCQELGYPFVPAPFTKCLVKKTDSIVIGGSNKYSSVCRKHW